MPEQSRNVDSGAKETAARNTKAGEMTHVSLHMPNLAAERQRLGAAADDMTVAELREAAETLQVDTAGATKKTDLQRVVKEAARPTTTKGA